MLLYYVDTKATPPPCGDFLTVRTSICTASVHLESGQQVKKAQDLEWLGRDMAALKALLSDYNHQPSLTNEFICHSQILDD